ncbi:MAG: hypothetical protein ACXVEI_02670 [Actinomycetota bacterium]
MSDAEEAPLTPEVEEPAILGTGNRYAWGTSGDIYSIWRTRDRKIVATFGGPRGQTSARVGFQALEAVARPGHRRRRILAVVCGVMVVAAAVVLGTLWIRAQPTSGASSVSPDGAASLQRFQDQGGRYAFRYPADWQAREDAGIAHVTSPDGAVAVSVQPVASGDPGTAARQAAVTSSRGWTQTQLEDVQYRDVGGLRAASVSGAGTDQAGTPVRLATFVVPGGSGNYAITVVVRADAGPETTTPGIESILSTFRLP